MEIKSAEIDRGEWTKCHYHPFKDKVTVKDGASFERCNFSQLVPGTHIFTGVRGLNFKNCNLGNCQVPLDAVVKNCNDAQVDYCSHNHPELVKQGLPVCSKNCKHISSFGWALGILVERKYVDKVVTKEVLETVRVPANEA